MTEQSDESGLGARFYLGIAGVCLLVGLGCFLLLILFWKAAVAWGVLGFFVLFAVVAFVGSWLADRRHPPLS